MILKKASKVVKSKYLAVPKAAVRVCTWGLPGWPLFLTLKPSKRNKKQKLHFTDDKLNLDCSQRTHSSIITY